MNFSDLFKSTKSKLYSNWGLFILSVIFVLIILIWNYGGSLNKIIESEENTVDEIILTAPTEDAQDAYFLEPAFPTKISIPKIGLEADFGESLGVDGDGAIEVPTNFEQVGWYKHGPTPGEMGPSVVLGHVDSFDSPAVFFSLGQLKVGDDIQIEREDGSLAYFVVEKLDRIQQRHFPTEQVYGDLNYAGLRLITCSGIFVRGVQQYTHNLIVYARLVE